MKIIIDAIEEATGLKPKPFYTDKVEKCIVYSFQPLWNDGAVEKIKLQIRIIAATLEESAKIAGQISKKLINLGDTAKLNGYRNIILNGGGEMKDYNTDTINYIQYYEILKKSEVN